MTRRRHASVVCEHFPSLSEPPCSRLTLCASVTVRRARTAKRGSAHVTRHARETRLRAPRRDWRRVRYSPFFWLGVAMFLAAITPMRSRRTFPCARPWVTPDRVLEKGPRPSLRARSRRVARRRFQSAAGFTRAEAPGERLEALQHPRHCSRSRDALAHLSEGQACVDEVEEARPHRGEVSGRPTSL